MDLLDKLKEKLKVLTDAGVPIILARDKGQPSITFTLMVVSGALAVASLFGNLSDTFGLKYDQCKDLLMYVSLLYLGRKFQKGDLTAEQQTEEKK